MNLRSLFFAAVLIVSQTITLAHASFHLFRIDQIYSNADGSVQYVVMRESTGSNGENFWAGLQFRTTNAAGVIKTFTVPSNLPSSSTASRSVLLATAGFAALGIVASAQAMPVAPMQADGLTTQVAQGCGPGFSRNAAGKCRPSYMNRACGPGMHRNYIGRCRPNR